MMQCDIQMTMDFVRLGSDCSEKGDYSRYLITLWDLDFVLPGARGHPTLWATV